MSQLTKGEMTVSYRKKMSRGGSRKSFEATQHLKKSIIFPALVCAAVFGCKRPETWGVPGLI